MINFYRADNVTRFEGDRREIHGITTLLVKEDPKAKYSDKYKLGEWDGFVNFLEPDGYSFLTGFLQYVTYHLEKLGIEYQVDNAIELGPKADIPIDYLEGITLRDYQITAIRRSIHYKRGILKIPPRGGKTACQIAVAKYLDQPSILIVGSQELLSQHEKEFKRWLPEDEVGVFGAGTKRLAKHNIVMVQSLIKALNDPLIRAWLEKVSIIQADEAHHLGSAVTWQEVFKQCSATWRLGWSGTPFRISDASKDKDSFSPSDFWLMGHTGRKLLDVKSSDLIRDGHVADATVYPITISTSSKGINKRLRPEQGTWVYNTLYKSCITDNEIRNSAIIKAAHSLTQKERQTLILVKHLNHGREIQKGLHELDVESVFLQGQRVVETYDGRTHRKRKDPKGEVLQDVKEGLYSVMIASPAFDEGVNLPSIDAIIIAGAGRSTIKTLQGIFRALTASQDGEKKMVFAVDFQDEMHWLFSSQSKARLKEYSAEGLRVAKRVPEWLA